MFGSVRRRRYLQTEAQTIPLPANAMIMRNVRIKGSIILDTMLRLNKSNFKLAYSFKEAAMRFFSFNCKKDGSRINTKLRFTDVNNFDYDGSLRAPLRNFHLRPCKIRKLKIAKLCHNKELPKPFLEKICFSLFR